MATSTADQTRGEIQLLPGGSRILSGGTRSKIKLSRPWQADLANLVNPSKCPFCNQSPEQRAKELFSVDGEEEVLGWNRLVNLFTPHPDHRLVIPDACWTAEMLQRWGGPDAFLSAFRVAGAETGNGREKLYLVHVGIQGGQNLGHPHMHVLTTLAEKPLHAEDLSSLAADETIRIFGRPEDGLVAVASGSRSGECWIIPTEPLRMTSSEARLGSFAGAVSKLVDLGNAAFMSEQGLAPPWGLAVRTDWTGYLRYAVYSPTLHHWGVLEYSVCPAEGAPYVLPWPHKMSASYLREKLAAQ